MNEKIIIALIAMVIWVIIVSTSKMWIGTKLGDILILLLGAASVYGLMNGANEFYSWIVK
jgi:hypothetical protein